MLDSNGGVLLLSAALRTRCAAASSGACATSLRGCSSRQQFNRASKQQFDIASAVHCERAVGRQRGEQSFGAAPNADMPHSELPYIHSLCCIDY